MKEKELKVEDLVVAEGLEVFKGKDGLFYVNDGNGTYVAEIKTVKEDHYEKDEDGNELITEIKKHIVEGPLTDIKGRKILEISQHLGRADRKNMKREQRNHFTKKLKKVRKKVLYGDKDITRLFKKGLHPHMAARYSN
jgi:hypothetical protein